MKGHIMKANHERAQQDLELEDTKILSEQSNNKSQNTTQQYLLLLSILSTEPLIT